MGRKEYILIAVMYGSLLAGLALPERSAAISGYIKYLMMTMLFLAFIKISPEDIVKAFTEKWSDILRGALLCLVVAPAVAFGITRILYPPLDLPILLLAGASTGVSAPFFTSVCKGNISYCLVMAIATSLILPFSLPLMVKILADATLTYDLFSMALFLAMIIFVPLVLALGFRKLLPEMLKNISQVSYPISLIVLTGINFGALGKYVSYLQANPTQIFLCILFAIGLAMILALIGWYSSKSGIWADKMACSGSQIWVNNILIIALAVHMNNALAATLSALYLIPYYGFVVLYSVMAKRAEG